MGHPFVDWAFRRVKEKRNVAVQMPAVNPEVTGRVVM